MAAKAKQPAKHPSGFEKDVRNNAKKNDKGEVEQQSIPDNLVPASNSPVKRKATAESGSSMAKKMKAAEMNQNDSNVIDIDGDQNSDIPGIRSDSADQLVNAPVLESVNMDTDSSNRSQSVSVEPGKGPRTMMHNGTAQDDEQKKAIQAAHNRKKQAAKNNSMFINKKKVCSALLKIFSLTLSSQRNEIAKKITIKLSKIQRHFIYDWYHQDQHQSHYYIKLAA